MNIAQLKNEIAWLKAQIPKAERLLAGRRDEVRQAISADPDCYSEQEVEATERAKLRVERELSRLNDRVKALETQLPSDAEMRRAAETAQRLEEVLETANARCDALIANYLDALDRAEIDARQLIAARIEAAAAAASLMDVKRNWGLDRAVGSATVLSAIDATKRAHLVGLLLSEAPYGEPSEVVTRELAGGPRRPSGERVAT